MNMRWIVPIVLLLVACAEKPAPGYRPDLSTFQGAVEVYGRAINELDEGLAAMVFGSEGRERQLESFRRNVQLARERNVRFEVRFDESYQQGEDVWITRAAYYRLNEKGEAAGKPSEQAWFAFAREADSMWRIDSKRSREYTAKLMPQRAPAPQAPKPAEEPEPAAPGTD